MERGDADLGRDAYGLPRRRRLGERRAFRSGGAATTGARGTDGASGVNGLEDDEDAEYYGQLLRRPGDLPPYQSRLRQPGRQRTQQPGRFPQPGEGYPQPGGGYPQPGGGYTQPGGQPGGGYPQPGGGYPQPGRGYPQPGGGYPQPGGGYPPNGDYAGNGDPASRYPRNGDPASRYPRDGDPASRYPRDGDPASGYPGNGDPAGGNPGSGNPAGGYPGNGYPPGGGYPGSGNPAGGYGPGAGAADGGPLSGGPAGRRQYRLPNGRRVPPGADRLYYPGAPGSAGGSRGRPGTGQGPDPLGGTWSRPGRPAPAAGAPPGPGGAHGGVRADGGSGWEHLRVPPSGRGVPISAEPPASTGPAGPVIRQRESALPDERPTATAQPVASIAPDGLDSFARDLRALRAKAELDYPAMAEVSHYTMKTLASAAGGLRLPTLPVAVAYVRACGGNVAEWEDRWQKLAAKITADAKRRRADGDDDQGPPEPADPPAIPEPPALPVAKDLDPAAGEVYVITSAKPRQQDW